MQCSLGRVEILEKELENTREGATNCCRAVTRGHKGEVTTGPGAKHLQGVEVGTPAGGAQVCRSGERLARTNPERVYVPCLLLLAGGSQTLVMEWLHQNPWV